MLITLSDVNKDNFDAVCELSVSDNQRDYIAENAYSIAQSKFYPSCQIRAICLNGEPVGFFMWMPEDNQKIMIWRFMVDKNHQNKGIGRKALLMALEEIRHTDQLAAIGISYKPDNLVAKNLYASLGFVDAGIDEEAEEMVAVITV